MTGVSGLVRGILSPPSIDTASLRRKADDDSPAPVAGLSNRQPHVSKKNNPKNNPFLGPHVLVSWSLSWTRRTTRDGKGETREGGEGRGGVESTAVH